MSNHPDLSGHCVFITGAARGLGKSMAVKLATCGATVGVSDLVLQECEHVVEEIRSGGGQAHAYALDVAVRKLF
ncbi:MAG: SDR family NAD(P)-dependent oxidoreductase, partial [Pseudomonadota bacterium]